MQPDRYFAECRRPVHWKLARAHWVSLAQCVALAVIVSAAMSGSAVAAATARPKPLNNLPTPTGKQVNKGRDNDTYTPNALVAGVAPAPTGLQPLVSPYNGTFHCFYNDVTVASFPSGYVEGNCMVNDEVDVTQVSAETGGEFYFGGLVGGDYSGCGWIDTSNVSADNNNSHTSCASPSTADCDFIYCVGTTEWVWSSTDGKDGMTFALPSGAACNMFANFRPWSTSNAPTDLMTAIYGPTNIKIRYLTKYQWGDSYWVLIHYVSGSFNHWGFVPQVCL
jgi:hypothetical protein